MLWNLFSLNFILRELLSYYFLNTLLKLGIQNNSLISFWRKQVLPDHQSDFVLQEAHKATYGTIFKIFSTQCFIHDLICSIVLQSLYKICPSLIQMKSCTFEIFFLLQIFMHGIKIPKCNINWQLLVTISLSIWHIHTGLQYIDFKNFTFKISCLCIICRLVPDIFLKSTKNIQAGSLPISNIFYLKFAPLFWMC